MPGVWSDKAQVATLNGKTSGKADDSIGHEGHVLSQEGTRA